MNYLNTLIVEKKQEPIKTDDISTPLNSNSTNYEEILVNKPVPWYGHTRTNSSDEPIVFPARQTYTSISIEPKTVYIEVWIDDKKIFFISLNVSSFDNDKDNEDISKNCLIVSNANGELYNTAGEDYIDNLTEKLETLASKLIQNEDTENIWSIVLVDEQGLKIEFVLKDKRILFQMLFNGKETIIEEFDTYEKVIAYTYLLNSAKEKAM